MLVPCWNVTIMTQSMVGLKWCQNQALGHGLNKNKSHLIFGPYFRWRNGVCVRKSVYRPQIHTYSEVGTVTLHQICQLGKQPPSVTRVHPPPH